MFVWLLPRQLCMQFADMDKVQPAVDAVLLQVVGVHSAPSCAASGAC
jgi:hypothetical protein